MVTDRIQPLIWGLKLSLDFWILSMEKGRLSQLCLKGTGLVFRNTKYMNIYANICKLGINLKRRIVRSLMDDGGCNVWLQLPSDLSGAILVLALCPALTPEADLSRFFSTPFCASCYAFRRARVQWGRGRLHGYFLTCFLFFIHLFEKGSHVYLDDIVLSIKQPKTTLNSWSSCFYLLSASIAGSCLHTHVVLGGVQPRALYR